MITRLEIENFKAIKHLAIDLDPLTVLVGPNDSGKSTILQALDLLCRLARNQEPELHRTIQQWTRDLDDNNAIRIVVSGVAGPTDPPTSYALDVRFGPRFGGDHQISVSLRKNGEPAGNVQTNYRGALDGLPDWVTADLDSRMVSFDPRALAAPCRSNAPFDADGAGLAALLLRLRTDLDERPFDALVDDLRRMSPFFTSLGLDTSSQAGVVGARFAIGTARRPAPAETISSGVLLMTGYLALLHGTTSPRFLVEEPENGVHPQAILQIADVLRNLAHKGRQVVMTTHSPILLGYMDPAGIRIVTRSAADGVKVTPAYESKAFNELRQKIDFADLWYMAGDEAVARTDA